MQQFLDQARENERTLADDEQYFPTTRFEWKTTFIFYIALHWMKAFLMGKHGFKEPESHAEVRAYYRENKHIMKPDAYRDYNTLSNSRFRLSLWKVPEGRPVPSTRHYPLGKSSVGATCYS